MKVISFLDFFISSPLGSWSHVYELCDRGMTKLRFYILHPNNEKIITITTALWRLLCFIHYIHSNSCEICCQSSVAGLASKVLYFFCGRIFLLVELIKTIEKVLETPCTVPCSFFTGNPLWTQFEPTLNPIRTHSEPSLNPLDSHIIPHHFTLSHFIPRPWFFSLFFRH